MYFASSRSLGLVAPTDDIVALCDELTPQAVAWIIIAVIPHRKLADRKLYWGLQNAKSTENFRNAMFIPSQLRSTWVYCVEAIKKNQGHFLKLQEAASPSKTIKTAAQDNPEAYGALPSDSDPEPDDGEN